jgi:cytochrome c-type biogenesis protein CcmE
MSKKAVRVSLSAVVLASALTWLMISTISQGAEYYKTVDEVMADPAAWHGKRLQVHGFVLGDPLMKASTLEYRFKMHHNGKVMDAYYKGLVPDTFKAEAEVVVKGQLDSDGAIHIQPDGITAKCPSRYEASKAPLAVR